MKAVYTISITDILGKILNTREAVQEITKVVESGLCQVIELDFTNVEFMSRSFADEFHKERLRLIQNHNVAIDILNAPEEVIRILQAVEKTQNKAEREMQEVQVFKFSNPELIKDYFLSI